MLRPFYVKSQIFNSPKIPPEAQNKSPNQTKGSQNSLKQHKQNIKHKRNTYEEKKETNKNLWCGG